MEWCRLYHDMVTDPKWRVIARRAVRPLPEVVAVWTLMLITASQANPRGTLDDWVDEDAAAALDMDPADVAAIRDAMQGKVLDGDTLTGWDKRQPKRERPVAEPSTARVQAHRERQKAQRNASETPCNATERQETPREEERRVEEKEDSSLRSESRAPALLDCGPAELDEVDQAVAEWNALADDLNLPKVQKLNTQRKARLKARLREAGGLGGWRHALGKIRGSPFLRGERSRWRASFDFLLQEQSFTRLMEGSYDDRDPAQQDTTAERRSDIAELLGERFPEYRRAS